MTLRNSGIRVFTPLIHTISSCTIHTTNNPPTNTYGVQPTAKIRSHRRTMCPPSLSLLLRWDPTFTTKSINIVSALIHLLHHRRHPATPKISPPKSVAKASAINAQTAVKVTPRVRVFRSIASSTAPLATVRENPSAASTATKCTSRWAPSRCTSGRTRCRASATSAARPFRARGYYKVTSGRTRAKNPSRAPTAIAPLPIAPTCALICRLIRTSKSTRAYPAAKPSRECLCSPSTPKLVAVLDTWSNQRRCFEKTSTMARKVLLKDWHVVQMYFFPIFYTIPSSCAKGHDKYAQNL